MVYNKRISYDTVMKQIAKEVSIFLRKLLDLLGNAKIRDLSDRELRT